MTLIDLKKVGDTEGGHIQVRETMYQEVGIVGTGAKKGVYWHKEDTEKVIEALKKLEGVV